MNPSLPVLDLIVLSGYLVAVVGFGCWFARKSKSADEFMAAGRSLPGWAVGLAIFGSYVSSISFLANPGKAYAANWNPFVFAISLPLAAWAAQKWFVPFFRHSGELSAYHHLESRFGPWARTYGVVCYLLTQLARLGTILYLLALALRPLVGLDLVPLILISGLVITIYPFFGGTEGVMWTGVVQAIVLIAGALTCLVVLLLGVPGGASELMSVANAEDKFSLGSLATTLSQSTVWVVLAYGLATNLQNFGIDQSYVQRYLTARSDRDAVRSVWIGALSYIPISAVFLFIGTALFVFYRKQPQLLPDGIRPDDVFPHFIGTQLPPGLQGLVVAAICSAAMDSNLNCCATLFLCDIYRRYVRPQSTDAESMRVLRITTLVMGALGTMAAVAMIGVKSALDAWWKLASIFSGGILGLFLLGLISRRVTNRVAKVSTALGVLTIIWLTCLPILNPITPSATQPAEPSALTQMVQKLPPFLNTPVHDNLIIVFGTLVILISGCLFSFFARAQGESKDL
jgi:SSS family solute:Na+ symporter